MKHDDCYKSIEQLTAWPEFHSGYGGGPFFQCCNLAEEAFGDVAQSPCLSHLAYLYRRFGPPFCGGDNHKEIANYILTTTKPGFWFWVACKASDLRFCFGVLFDKSVADALGYSRHDEDTPTAKEYRRELVACFRELLRPVYVRDCAINLLGACEDDWDNAAEPSRYAGYGCSHEALDALIRQEDSPAEPAADGAGE